MKIPTKYVLRSHKITEEQYTTLYQGQGGRCAICNKAKKLVIDHDHATNKVRGLLCAGCNNALGMLGDSTTILSQGIKYLRSYEKIF